MARYQTVVKVVEPVLDAEGNQVDQDGDPIDGTNHKKEQIAVWEEVMYYLLHWGLTYTMDEHGKNPVSYTVGICQHIKSGEIKSFVPPDLTVVGKEKQE